MELIAIHEIHLSDRKVMPGAAFETDDETLAEYLLSIGAAKKPKAAVAEEPLVDDDALAAAERAAAEAAEEAERAAAEAAEAERLAAEEAAAAAEKTGGKKSK